MLAKVCDFASPDRAVSADLPRTQTQKVVVVNGTNEILALLDPIFETGGYDSIVIVDDKAYSNVKLIQPRLVILCVDEFNLLDTLSALSMLKLDDYTKNIPVLTYCLQEFGADGDEDKDDHDNNEDDSNPTPGRVISPKRVEFKN